MRNLPEIVGQIRIDHIAPSDVQRPVRPLDSVERAPVRPAGALLRLQVGLEDRRQHKHRRRPGHPIPDAGQTQWPELPALLLRDGNPPDRFRSVGSLLRIPRQFPDPPVNARLLDALERFPADACDAAVQAGSRPGRVQDVRPPHLVGERVKPEVRILLGFRMQRRPESPDAVRGCWTSASSHGPFILSTLLSNRGPFAPPALPGISAAAGLSATPAGPACPSRGSGSARAADGGFPCCCFHHLPRMLPPMPRRSRTVRCSLPVRWQPSSHSGRVGPRIEHFEACSASARVAACAVAEPPNAALFFEVLQSMSLPP